MQDNEGKIIHKMLLRNLHPIMCNIINQVRIKMFDPIPIQTHFLFIHVLIRFFLFILTCKYDEIFQRNSFPMFDYLECLFKFNLTESYIIYIKITINYEEHC